MPIRSGSRGSPTWFGRTAGGSIKSERKTAECATSHSREATGPDGRGPRPSSVVFAALTAPTNARAGSRGCFMSDLTSVGEGTSDHGDVRGAGYFQAIELVKEPATKASFTHGRRVCVDRAAYDSVCSAGGRSDRIMGEPPVRGGPGGARQGSRRRRSPG